MGCVVVFCYCIISVAIESYAAFVALFRISWPRLQFVKQYPWLCQQGQQYLSRLFVNGSGLSVPPQGRKSGQGAVTGASPWPRTEILSIGPGQRVSPASPGLLVLVIHRSYVFTRHNDEFLEAGINL